MFLLLYSTVFADGEKNNNLIWKKVKTPEKDHNSRIKWKKYNDQNYNQDLKSKNGYGVGNYNNVLLLNDK